MLAVNRPRKDDGSDSTGSGMPALCCGFDHRPYTVGRVFDNLSNRHSDGGDRIYTAIHWAFTIACSLLRLPVFDSHHHSPSRAHSSSRAR